MTNFFKKAKRFTVKFIDSRKKMASYRKLYLKYKDFTMIPPEDFCANLELCEKYDHLQGNIVECGTWKGGMIAAMAEVMGSTNRKYYLFDSFEGLPQAQEIDGVSANEWQKDTSSPYYFNNCEADIVFAESAMQMAGIKNANIIKGWFDDTLPQCHMDEKIAILRLDGDWYDSIYPCMKYLYPFVTKGGLVVIDDYYIWEGTSKAIHDYLSEIKSSSKIYTLSGGIAFIKKD